MLLKSGLLHEYLKAAKTLPKITGSYISWNETSHKIRLNTKPVKVCFLVCFFFGLAQTYDVFIKISASHPFDEELTLGILLGLALILISQFSYSTLKYSKVIEEFVHGLMMFERWYAYKTDCMTFQDKRKLSVAKFTCILMRITGIVATPFVLAILATMFPWLPMNVLSYPPGNALMALVQTFCDTNITWISFKLIFVKCILFLTNSFVWYNMFKGGVMVSNRIFFGSVSLAVAVSIFKRNITSIRVISLGWKRIGTDIIFKKSILIYRQIQILNSLFNQIHSAELVTFLFMVIIGQVISAFNIIGKPEKPPENNQAVINSWIRIFFVQVIILCVVVINVMYGFCGIVHDLSKKCLEKIRHDVNISRSPKYRKIMMSLKSIDIQFGSANFIEKTTPVVYQQFAAQRTVDFLLLYRKNKV